jgi:hypothetical protein
MPDQPLGRTKWQVRVKCPDASIVIVQPSKVIREGSP